MTYAILGMLVPAFFALGFWSGRRDAKRQYRREIDAGEEYLAALDEASRECLPGSRLHIDLLVRSEPVPAARGRAHLRLHVVGDE